MLDFSFCVFLLFLFYFYLLYFIFIVSSFIFFTFLIKFTLWKSWETEVLFVSRRWGTWRICPWEGLTRSCPVSPPCPCQHSLPFPVLPIPLWNASTSELMNSERHHMQCTAVGIAAVMQRSRGSELRRIQPFVSLCLPPDLNEVRSMVHLPVSCLSSTSGFQKY